MLPSKVLSLLAKPKQTVRFELTTSRTADTSHSTRFTVLLMSQTRITLNRGPAGWRPCCQMKNMNYPRGGELHRRAGRQSALQDCPVGCTLRWAGGLLIKLGYRNGRSGGLLFSEPTPPSFAARSIALLCSPPARPSVLSSVQPADSSRLSFGNTALQPARPAGPPISVIPQIQHYIWTKLSTVRRAK